MGWRVGGYRTSRSPGGRRSAGRGAAAYRPQQGCGVAVAHVRLLAQYSLEATVWHVWFCEVPLGDAPIEADVVENRLNQEIAAYLGVDVGRQIPADVPGG